MIMNSLKTSQDFSINKLGLPRKFVIQNYIDAWNTAYFKDFFINSIIVSVIAVIITVLFGALAAYFLSRFKFNMNALIYAFFIFFLLFSVHSIFVSVIAFISTVLFGVFAAYFLSRFKFKMNSLIYGFFIFGLLVPVHATLVPMFLFMQNLGLLNTRLALILPYIAFNLPITIFLLYSFMRAFPMDIEESAIMDGASVFRIFWSIILPMSKPAIATVTILCFINNWNEFVFALVLINDSALQTLPLGLQNFAGQYSTNYVAQMAGLTMALIPILVVFLFLEKEIVKGMTPGAVKG